MYQYGKYLGIWDRERAYRSNLLEMLFLKHLPLYSDTHLLLVRGICFVHHLHYRRIIRHRKLFEPRFGDVLPGVKKGVFRNVQRRDLIRCLEGTVYRCEDYVPA